MDVTNAAKVELTRRKTLSGGYYWDVEVAVNGVWWAGGTSPTFEGAVDLAADVLEGNERETTGVTWGMVCDHLGVKDG